MPVDFSRLGKQGKPASALTEPRRIFASLPAKQSRFAYLRDVQGEVLEQWHQRRVEADLVIKMNTGSGKTAVGLLALQSCLNEGVGPALYVTPDTYLTTQVLEEATALGIPVSSEVSDTRFLKGEAIAVVNIHKVFNGRSVFGVAPQGVRVKLGSILVDDAHACVAAAESTFSLNIPRGDAYDDLLDLFEDDLSHQSPSRLIELRSKDPAGLLPIPYWAWRSKLSTAMQRIHEVKADVEQVAWTWPLIAPSLAECQAVFSAEALEIRPPCLPVEAIPAFRRAERRIYLTATLADDSLLVTDFAADEASVSKSIVPGTAGDIGERMIILPQESTPTTSEDELRLFIEQLAREHNVVVIVPSNRRAAVWSGHAAFTLDRHNVHEGVAKLRAGHVGLVVMVNRYDGIDLPGAACRVLVLDGLPEAYSASDRLAGEQLGDSETTTTRQLQRIEQGMGRGIRSSEDHCVVILLGTKLTKRFHDQGAEVRLSPATRAQVALSRELAAELAGASLAELRDTIDHCLNRDPDWVKVARASLADVVYGPTEPIDPIAVARRSAFGSAAIGQHSGASDAIRAVVAQVSGAGLRGLLKQEAASYLNAVDAIAAQQLQVSAIKDNPALLKPLAGIAYGRLSAPVASQAGACAKFLASTYLSGNDLLIGINALLEDLTMGDPENADAFEQAMYQLGTHLGFGSQRPDRDFGRGPDNLWAVGGLNFLVIECKSGAASDSISKRDAAQLGQAQDWFVETYDDSATATPVLVHPTRLLHEKATARAETRVIDIERLGALRESVRNAGVALSRGDSFRDERAVATQLTGQGLTSTAILETFTRKPRRAR